MVAAIGTQHAGERKINGVQIQNVPATLPVFNLVVPLEILWL
jgi:hypothetical protein